MLRALEEEEQQRVERLHREQVDAQRNLAARVQSSTTEVCLWNFVFFNLVIYL